MYGLWCQVETTSNIGDWYYPSTGNPPDGFTLVPTSDPSNAVPYQSLKCTNQIGLVVDGNVTNNQGIVRCSTTVPNLSREANYFGVYSDDVYNNFGKFTHLSMQLLYVEYSTYFFPIGGPLMDTNMTLFLLSSKDAEHDVNFTLSFNVSYGPPSRIRCKDGNNVEIIHVPGPTDSRVFHEVIRSHYVNSSHPDKTRVILTLTQERRETTYTCTVTVEGRSGINSSNYAHVTKGTGSSTTIVTSECVLN